jgi:hypothetical protein
MPAAVALASTGFVSANVPFTRRPGRCGSLSTTLRSAVSAELVTVTGTVAS